MSRVPLLAVLLVGCKPDYNPSAQRRVLTTEQATFDAGVVAVNDRETLTVYLASTGAAPVTVWDVHLEDESDPNWVLLDTWKNDTALTDDGEEVEVLAMEGGSADNPTYAPVEVSFRPTDEGYYHATLIIESNDTEVVEQDPETGNSIWKVVLRGVARYPCAKVYPLFHDFGPRPTGSYWTSEATIENCGSVTLTVSTYTLSGDQTFGSDSVFPLIGLAGGVTDLNLSWNPSSSEAEDAEMTLVTNAPDLDDTLTLIGNDCESSVNTRWDEDGDGWFSCGGDCDDTDPDIHPEAVDGKDDDADRVDNDCDDETDEGAGLGADNDGDGYTENDGDCWDNNSDVYPGAPETPNQVDDDCNDLVDDATSWYDDDGDGLSEREGDCDDRDDAIYPGAEEAYDTIDNDCDDNVDEGTYSFDDDEDGYAEIQADGSTGDCDDADPWVYPGGAEDCDDVDNDCDGATDEGDDGAEDGACDFLVERETVTVEESGCATAGGRASALGLLAALGLLSLRRRRRA